MADVRTLDLYANGEWIFVFDGRVLEIFGPWERHTAKGAGASFLFDSWRIYVTQLNVKVTGPDKKGNHEVTFCSHAQPNGIFTATPLDEAKLNRLQPLLDALAKAKGATGPADASDEGVELKTGRLQDLLIQHDVHLASQPDDVRSAVVSDLQAAGVSIDPVSRVMRLTDPGQGDAALEVYKRHSLLPADASIS